MSPTTRSLDIAAKCFVDLLEKMRLSATLGGPKSVVLHLSSHVRCVDLQQPESGANLDIRDSDTILLGRIRIRMSPAHMT
jgi:hypothetical protein